MTWYRFPIWMAIGAVPLAGCDSGADPCGSGSERVGSECVEVFDETGLRLNGVGFLPEGRKIATFAGEAESFRVLRADDRGVAFEGQTSARLELDETLERNLRTADFSELREEGEYVLEVDGAGRSPAFRIGGDVYAGVLDSLMLGLYGQRCGGAVDLEHGGSSYEHAECHMDDAWLDEYGDPESKRPTLFGWHDAGDYGKYTNNGSFSLGMMLLAWQQYQPALERVALDIPERGGAFPDYLDECKFQLDWLLSMQLDDGSVADRVTTRTFDPMTVSPEASRGRRFLAPATTQSTADFVAVVARAARAFEPYDAELAASYRAAAERGWAFLLENPDDNTMAIAGGASAPGVGAVSGAATVRQRFTGGYWSSDPDDRVWAAVEIWETTGNEDALAAFEAGVENVRLNLLWDWPELGNMGLYTYLLSSREGRDAELVERLTGVLRGQVTSILQNVASHPYGRPVGGQYYWGINGVAARTALSVGVLDALTPDPAHRDAIAAGLDHLLGRNYYGRSYVTGLGHNPPRNPHHRPSQADSSVEPWPGLLVGGPSQGDMRTNSDGTTEMIPPALTWRDENGDFRSNEVAINWNAAMIYAAAALLPE